MTCRCLTSMGYWRRATCRALTESETQEARDVGRERHERSWARRSVDSVNPKTKAQDLAKHVLGAGAEYAWCILMGLPWSKSVDAFGEPDVPPDIEIRCRDGWHNIIVRDADMTGPRGKRRYIAAVHEDGVYRFYGWLWGHEAKAFTPQDMGRYGKPARFIDVAALHRLPLTHPHSGTLVDG